MEQTPAATQVAEYQKTEATLAELRQIVVSTKFDVATKEGMAAARKLRHQLRSLRTGLDAIRVECKKPLLFQTRQLDSEAQRITREIVKLEEPIDAKITEVERIEAEKKTAAEQAERERVADIQKRIADLERLPATLVGKTAAELAAALQTIWADDPKAWAQELTAKADATRLDVVAKVRQMHAAAEGSEAEAKRQAEERKRLEAERAEFERKQAEQRAAEEKAKAAREAAEAESRRRIEEQERAARLAREEEDRKSREAIEAEKRRAAEDLAKREAALKAERDGLDAQRRAKEEAEHQAKLQAEREAEEKARAERERQEQERLALEKRQREEQQAREDAEREKRRALQERMDAHLLLRDFVARYGHLDEFKPIADKIRAFCELQTLPA